MSIKEYALKQCNTDKEKDRLLLEFEEINKQGLWGYFEELIKSGEKYHNENNLLCAYLWGICPENPLENNRDLIFVQSNEMPDIDIDITPNIRNEIKEYCANKYGQDRVMSIVNYNTFGIKTGIRDISRVKGVPLSIVNNCTTKLGDDIDKISWQEALSKYPSLKEFENYNEETKEVCRLARKFSQRIKSIGKHAGGVCISNKDLTQTIPLITTKSEDSEKRFIVSSFSEGQNRSDLKNFGLVKLDFLGLKNLDYIDDCLVFINKRYYFIKLNGFEQRINVRKNLKNISIIRDNNKIVLNNIKELQVGDIFLGKEVEDIPRELNEIGMFKLNENSENWSDETYLNDHDSIMNAKAGDLSMIFQFDAPLVKKMSKDAQISRFEDMVSLTSINRPGPLDCLPLNTKINIENGYKEIQNLKNLYDKIAYLDINHEIKYTNKYILFHQGNKKCLKIKTKSRKEIICSENHKFLTENNIYKEAINLKTNDKITQFNQNNSISKNVLEIFYDEIESIEKVDIKDCYDISLLEKEIFYLNEPNYIAQDFVVHNSGMASEYIERKNGRKEFKLHPLLQPILEETFGVIVYQEQLMKIANVVGLISLPDCEFLRKAMAKKQEDKFGKFKNQFIENGQRTLEWTEEEVENLWAQMITFANYGFNKCITFDSIVYCKSGRKSILECKKGDYIKAYNTELNKEFYDEIVDIQDNGVQDIFEIKLENGHIIECTINHEFLCEDNKKRKLFDIIKNNFKIISL